MATKTTAKATKAVKATKATKTVKTAEKTVDFKNLFATAQAEQKAAAQQASIKNMFATAQAEQKAANTKATTTQAKATTKQTGTKATKDLTKRDVVVVSSASLQQAYICTSVKYSACNNAESLLVNDMLKRATLVELASAADATFSVLKAQVCVTEAQQTKYAQHCAYVTAGYKMLSTKGKNVTVVATA